MFKVFFILVAIVLSAGLKAENPKCDSRPYLISQYIDIVEKEVDIGLVSSLFDKSKFSGNLAGINQFILDYVSFNYPQDVFKQENNCLSYWAVISELKQFYLKRIKAKLSKLSMAHAQILNAPLFSNFDDYFLEKVKHIADFKKGHLIIIKHKPNKKLLNYLEKRKNYTLYSRSRVSETGVYQYNSIFDIAAREYLFGRMDKKSVSLIYRSILASKGKMLLCPNFPLKEIVYEDGFLKEMSSQILVFFKSNCVHDSAGTK